MFLYEYSQAYIDAFKERHEWRDNDNDDEIDNDDDDDDKEKPNF
jgi:hypothetical protein